MSNEALIFFWGNLLNSSWWRHQWKYFHHYWPFVRGINRSQVETFLSPNIWHVHKNTRSCVENECCRPFTVNIWNVNFTLKKYPKCSLDIKDQSDCYVWYILSLYIIYIYIYTSLIHIYIRCYSHILPIYVIAYIVCHSLGWHIACMSLQRGSHSNCCLQKVFRMVWKV